MSPEQIQQLIQLPLQALLLIAVVALWKAYNAAQNARVDDLKQNYERNLSDLRTRVILLEDRAGIHPSMVQNSTNKPYLPISPTKDPKLD